MKNFARIISFMLSVILGFSVLVSQPCPVEAASSYVVNGVTLPLAGYPDGGASYGYNQCWAFAQMVYQRIWGVPFTSYRQTNDDLLRNVATGSARAITAENTRNFISAAAPGATIRITDDISGSDVNGNNLHSQILIQKNAAGFTVYDSGNTRISIRYYTWSEYASTFAKYQYFKYIKFPGAPEYSAWQSQVGAQQDVGTNFYAYIIKTDGWKDLVPDANANIVIQPNSGATTHLWYFSRQSDGSYKISSAYDGKRLDVEGGSAESGTNVHAWPANDSPAQFWYIYGSSGDYKFQAKCGTCFLDVNEGSNVDGTRVHMWNWNGSVAQRFQIWKVDFSASTLAYTISNNKDVTFSWTSTKITNNYNLRLFKIEANNTRTDLSNWALTSTSKTISLNPGNYVAYIDSCNGDAANGFSDVRKSNEVTFSISSPSYTAKDFVERLYSYCLNRSSDPTGLTNWTNTLIAKQNTGANVAYGFFFSKEFLNRNVSDSAYIDVLYKAFFNRDADSAGKAYWTQILQNGCSREFVFAGFANSQEWKNLCSNYMIEPGTYQSIEPRDQNPNATAFVQRLYQVCLGRSNDVNGLNYWTQRLANKSTNGATVTYGFVFSAECNAKNLSNDSFVNLLYLALFNRVPSSTEKEGWIRQLNAGTSRQIVFNGFIYSTEFFDLCTKYGIARGSL